jgi:hypothetical protein
MAPNNSTALGALRNIIQQILDIRFMWMLFWKNLPASAVQGRKPGAPFLTPLRVFIFLGWHTPAKVAFNRYLLEFTSGIVPFAKNAPVPRES